MTIHNMTQEKLIAIILAPMISGCISFVASLTIITMIYRSNVKLSTSYRRLIFGMSVFDLIQSLSQASSSLPMPAGFMWGAIGNNTTCDFQGFLSVVGSSGSMLYSLSIAVYFLLIIKFNLSNRQIRKKYELILHSVPVLYSLIGGTSLFLSGSYNPAGKYDI